jgi:hypothetical protein
VEGRGRRSALNEYSALDAGRQEGVVHLSRPRAVPTETIDGIVQKQLLPGEVIAKITSGGEAGKVGPFMAGVTDGRQTLANIVGLNDTWLPWQLLEHDNEIAVAYDATAVQAWCFERDSGGLRIALTNTTAAAMVAQKGMGVQFK